MRHGLQNFSVKNHQTIMTFNKTGKKPLANILGKQENAGN